MFSAFILHFSDSVLPVGGYAHSFGLEGMVQMGVVHDVKSLELFLQRDVWHGLRNVDLPVALRAHQLVTNGEFSKLKELDQQARALRPTHQLRLASARIGKQTFSIYEKTWQTGNHQHGDQDDQLGVKKEHFADFQSPVVVGALFAEQKVSAEQCLCAVAYQCYSTLLQASLKILPTGPGSIQQLLYQSMKQVEDNLQEVLTMKESEWGTYQPVWDIAASRHERSPSRLFIS
ncbi:hypothetical protein OAB00_01605 [Akkermansiaceae bacterium]|nr:hypothetical protein [Akkermansiaceae bacterium]